METKRDRQHMLTRTGKRWSSFSRGHPVASALQIAEIPLECVHGLKGGGVGMDEQGMGFVLYLLCCALPPPPFHNKIYIFFSVSIKCQLNFLGAMRDVSYPSGCVARWCILVVCCTCRCVFFVCFWRGECEGVGVGLASIERDERWCCTWFSTVWVNLCSLESSSCDGGEHTYAKNMFRLLIDGFYLVFTATHQSLFVNS